MTDGEIGDERLVLEYRDGRADAMDLLLRRYQDQVLQFVLWRTGADFTEGEDIAQEVFLQVFRSAGSFRGDSRFRTWLYAVAGNVCSRWTRSRARRRSLETEGGLDVDETTQVADQDPGALEALQVSERENAVRVAVMKLESQHRTVLLLRDWEALTYAEMAVVLGIPVGTVKSRVHHARLQLARTLSSKLKEELL